MSRLLVAVPKLAQQRLNGAKLTIDGISITDTQPESLVLAINSTIKADDSVHATINPFRGTLYLADVDPPLAFAYVDFPQTTSSSLQAVNVTQEMRILDVGNLTAFTTALLSNDFVSVQVKGDTHIHVRGISRAYSATFDKTVTLKGLNNFEGLSISDPSISALSPTNNFNGTAHIPNQSVLVLEIVGYCLTSSVLLCVRRKPMSEADDTKIRATQPLPTTSTERRSARHISTISFSTPATTRSP